MNDKPQHAETVNAGYVNGLKDRLEELQQENDELRKSNLSGIAKTTYEKQRETITTLRATLESVKDHLLSLKIGKHNPCVETSYPGRCQECEHNRDMDEGIKLIDGSKEPQ